MEIVTQAPTPVLIHRHVCHVLVDTIVILDQSHVCCVLQANGQMKVLLNAECVAQGRILPKVRHRAVLVQRICFLILAVSIASHVLISVLYFKIVLVNVRHAMTF